MSLKWNVIRALTSPPVRWINFKFANRGMSPQVYYQVAHLVESGKIQTKVDTSMKGEAEYDPVHKTKSGTIKAPPSYSVGANDWVQKAALVHEGTHAALDVFFPGRDLAGNPSTMIALTDETIAYLAHAIYLIADRKSSQIAQDSRDPVYQAIQVARTKVEASITRGWDGCLTMDFTAPEVDVLKNTIKAHPLYMHEYPLTSVHDG